MFLDLIVRQWVNHDYQNGLEKEKIIGYKLALNKLGPGWINGQMVFDMTGIWRAAGIEAQGVNYFTIGAVENNHSSRFDYRSPYYQAWLGGYLVKFAQSRTWQINDHFKLGEADQKAWLAQYGDPKPQAAVNYQKIIEHKPIIIDKFRAKLYEGSIGSHTDVGKGRRPLLFPLYMTGFAQTFNKSKLGLKLKARNLTPENYRESLPISSFQPIELHGFVAIAAITKYIKAVVYANGAIFKDQQGNQYNTFDKLKPEFLRLMKAVKIYR